MKISGTAVAGLLGLTGLGLGFSEFASNVIAQATPDPISGGAGWLGAGMLGLVLGWFLIVRLPAQDKLNAEKDRQIAALVEAKDKAIIEKDRQIAVIIETRDRVMNTVVAEFRQELALKDKTITQVVGELRAELGASRADFRAELKAERDACRETFESIVSRNAKGKQP